MNNFTSTTKQTDQVKSRIAFMEDHVVDLLQYIHDLPPQFKQDYYKLFYEWTVLLEQSVDQLASLEQIEARN